MGLQLMLGMLRNWSSPTGRWCWSTRYLATGIMPGFISDRDDFSSFSSPIAGGIDIASLRRWESTGGQLQAAYFATSVANFSDAHHLKPGCALSVLPAGALEGLARASGFCVSG